MLLKEALSSAGKIKFFFKVLTLTLLKLFLRKNVFFISITGQESQAIKKFFPSAILKEIPNPIPFEIFDANVKNKLKQIIYFGRIHPHKNLELLIQGFINAKLDKGWKLKIYGIRDDEKYFDKLQKIIKNYDNINIYEPVFCQERQNIMSSSWANILVSKSEVLSLSILESSYFGLPSITNKNIELNEFKECVVLTSLNINELTNKIQDISRWSFEDRLEREKKIKSIARAKISNLTTSQSYLSFYNEIADYVDTKVKKVYEKIKSFSNFLKSQNFNFLLISSVYTFNLMFCSLFVVLLVLFGKYNLAAEMGLVTSFWLSITQIFSSNMRSIITSENNIKLSKETLYYRFIFSILLLLLFYYLVLTKFSFIDPKLTLSISTLILFQWIFEMIVLKFELSRYKSFTEVFMRFRYVVNSFLFFILFKDIKIFSIELISWL